MRFAAVDIFLDPNGQPLAAYQLEFFSANGQVKIVSIEGGEHPAFKDAPYYDPKAIQKEKVILAAFSTASVAGLPLLKTRVATIHLQITGGGHEYQSKLITAATATGKAITPIVTIEERKTR
ncbi:MAG: hypothetical protein AB1813_10680 [Verrucomicrobiota bacterium]